MSKTTSTRSALASLRLLRLGAARDLTRSAASGMYQEPLNADRNWDL